MSTTAEQIMKDYLKGIDVDTLTETLDTLEAKITGDWLRGLTSEEVIARSAVIEELEERLNLEDSILEIIGELEDKELPEYPELIRMARTRVGR